VNRNELVSKLHGLGTLKLVLLSIITLGVYESYYMKKQTRIINEYADEGLSIPNGFVSGIILLAWLSVALFIPYIITEDDHPIAYVSTFVDVLWTILTMMWSFKARNRMNTLLLSSKGQVTWFKGLWTFLFTACYFNYKINKIKALLPNQAL
jgi:hypothetical protein